ncbi:sensor histidine kinase [Sabulicella rubraurantiaca]|uniref:sensor histidine kinase n=1 Tax=Sabulicella rubraurantiaca TaxID=2811429 RepID=UPI001A95BC85|nr:ATP-binding protein [Sabulicella rubraurantiaca]
MAVASSPMVQLFMLTATTRALPNWIRYTAATALVALAALIRLALFGPEPGRPYFTFYPAIVITAVVFDRGSGFYAIALSALVAVWAFVEPAGSFAFRLSEAAALTYFILSALLVISLLEALHAALKEVAEHREQAEQDAWALAKAASDRETLLQEMVHRSRNDSQRLLATIQLRAAAPATSSSAAEALGQVAEQVAALARVNQHLEIYWRSDAVVEMNEFLHGLVADLRSGIAAVRPVALHVNAEPLSLHIERAVPVGLIVNELVVNALKYAFPGDREGGVWVCLRQEGDDMVLTVEDDGIGCDPAASPQGTGLGSRVVRTLAAQLGGRVVQGPGRSGDDGTPGTGWTVRFPVTGP